jgi:hypothetical protein
MSNILSDICLNNFSITIQDLLNYKPICDNSKHLFNIEYVVSEIVINLYQYLEKVTNIVDYKPLISVLDSILLSGSISHTNALDMVGKILACLEFMLNKIMDYFKQMDIQGNIKLFIS